MLEVKAPFDWGNYPLPCVFLAGSIEMGQAEMWQDKVVAALADCDGTILNPRRTDWDSSWKQDLSDPRFVQQVEWELNGQGIAQLVLFYFSPGTKSPIALLELGLVVGDRHKKAIPIVCCPEGFWRKGNVDIVCNRHGLKTAANLDTLIGCAREFIRLCVRL